MVSELVARGFKMRLNIVGFALAEEATKRETEQVTKPTNGRFLDAKNAKALTHAIEQPLAIRHEVLNAAGDAGGRRASPSRSRTCGSRSTGSRRWC